MEFYGDFSPDFVLSCVNQLFQMNNIVSYSYVYLLCLELFFL